MSGDGSYTSSLEGQVDGTGRRVALVVANFNAVYTHALRDRASETLREHGVEDADISVFDIPGAWELPHAAARVVTSKKYDAVIAIGCVIRGDTPHFDYIAAETTRGLGAVGLQGATPVIFGVLTTDTHEQARERADQSGLDKGREFALSALRMMGLEDELARLSQ